MHDLEVTLIGSEATVSTSLRESVHGSVPCRRPAFALAATPTDGNFSEYSNPSKAE
jgi:hypothetical protein